MKAVSSPPFRKAIRVIQQKNSSDRFDYRDRAMAFLGHDLEPKGQKILGTLRCVKDLIEFPQRGAKPRLLQWLDYPP
jgi:hypothetical protein